MIYQTEKNYEEAAKCYKNALRFEPGDPAILRDLAVIQASQSRACVCVWGEGGGGHESRACGDKTRRSQPRVRPMPRLPTGLLLGGPACRLCPRPSPRPLKCIPCRTTSAHAHARTRPRTADPPPGPAGVPADAAGAAGGPAQPAPELAEPCVGAPPERQPRGGGGGAGRVCRNAGQEDGRGGAVRDQRGPALQRQDPRGRWAVPERPAWLRACCSSCRTAWEDGGGGGEWGWVWVAPAVKTRVGHPLRWWLCEELGAVPTTPKPVPPNNSREARGRAESHSQRGRAGRAAGRPGRPGGPGTIAAGAGPQGRGARGFHVSRRKSRVGRCYGGGGRVGGRRGRGRGGRGRAAGGQAGGVGPSDPKRLLLPLHGPRSGPARAAQPLLT